MTAAEIRDFRRRLLAWYRKHRRDLPWRRTRDPYKIWVSEVMLQQTQVATVIPYYHRFLEQFPILQALADAEPRDLLKVWEGLGYYSRIRYFQAAACEVIRRHDGQVPSQWDDMIQLPGVGPYIAAAVLSIAYRRNHAVVDGNVKRVVARLCEEPTPTNSADAHTVFSAHVQPWVSPRRPDVFNQAIMELGALVCTPKTPVCPRCPVTRYCRAFCHGTRERFPVKGKRVSTPLHIMVAVVIEKAGKVLLVQRPANGLLGGLWEFPGGGVAKDESAEAAACRLLGETLNITASQWKPMGSIRHAYTHFKIELTVLGCTFLSGPVRRNGPIADVWIPWNRLTDYPIHRAHRKIIRQIERKRTRDA